MTELMEKTWAQYEAARARGDNDLADRIGDAYTVMDIIDMGQIEEHRDFAETTYYRWPVALDSSSPAAIVRGMLEEALVTAGILEAEDDGDDRNSADHLDEWAADQRYDQFRDMALMGYER